MGINPFFIIVVLGFVVYLYSYIRKMYTLLPKEFKELEFEYIPNLLKRNTKRTWYTQREFNRKYMIKTFHIVFLGFALLFLFKYLFNIETKIFLSFIKYSIIAARILICLVEIYYYIKIYSKHKDLNKKLDVKSEKIVLNFTIIQCVGFITEAILVIVILRFR